jgi:hypothetical protein
VTGKCFDPAEAHAGAGSFLLQLRPHVGAPLAAHRADEAIFYVGQPKVIGHFLIPTDGSELAEHEDGLTLAKCVGARVPIIIVEEWPGAWLTFAEPGAHAIIAQSPIIAQFAKPRAAYRNNLEAQ